MVMSVGGPGIRPGGGSNSMCNGDTIFHHSVQVGRKAVIEETETVIPRAPVTNGVELAGRLSANNEFLGEETMSRRNSSTAASTGTACT